ncbi:predicted protein [Naegleria gruberi]|uniref:Predicted protein n=1 Tax=Naegleria gruberi TaxID=5762 RepID=D2W4E9_NAEGR|nr:uncharacterized protein NAEGRDRAFT_76280 [Naegleria gruberi]EFC36052.1 predicted protein [Naegleria gruberi]|eukprot:XP_002668796.1 predicted protein [Naegleria gruberi strain NEG-M]
MSLQNNKEQGIYFERRCDSCKKSLHTVFYQPISSAKFKIQIKCNCENSECKNFTKEKLGCCLCDYSCVKSETLLKHITKEHSIKFPKVCCDKHYTTMEEYVDHINFKHQTNTKSAIEHQPLKRLCLSKPEKPVKLSSSANTSLQHVITPQNDTLECKNVFHLIKFKPDVNISKLNNQ